MANVPATPRTQRPPRATRTPGGRLPSRAPAAPPAPPSDHEISDEFDQWIPEIKEDLKYPDRVHESYLAGDPPTKEDIEDIVAKANPNIGELSWAMTHSYAYDHKVRRIIQYKLLNEMPGKFAEQDEEIYVSQKGGYVLYRRKGEQLRVYQEKPEVRKPSKWILRASIPEEMRRAWPQKYGYRKLENGEDDIEYAMADEEPDPRWKPNPLDLTEEAPVVAKPTYDQMQMLLIKLIEYEADTLRKHPEACSVDDLYKVSIPFNIRDKTAVAVKKVKQSVLEERDFPEPANQRFTLFISHELADKLGISKANRVLQAKTPELHKLLGAALDQYAVADGFAWWDIQFEKIVPTIEKLLKRTIQAAKEHLRASPDAALPPMRLVYRFQMVKRLSETEKRSRITKGSEGESPRKVSKLDPGQETWRRARNILPATAKTRMRTHEVIESDDPEMLEALYKKHYFYLNDCSLVWEPLKLEIVFGDASEEIDDL